MKKKTNPACKNFAHFALKNTPYKKTDKLALSYDYDINYMIIMFLCRILIF